MAERQKRTVIKPPRYMTMSSDEVGNRKRIKSMNEDVRQLKKFILDNEPRPTISQKVHLEDRSAELVHTPQLRNYKSEDVGMSEACIHHEYLMEPQEDTDNRTLGDRITVMESELKHIGNMLETVLKNQTELLKYLQPQSSIRKPDILPLCNAEEVEDFDNIDDNTYLNVVQYLRNIGGFSVKQAIHFCLKETVKDEALASYTWWGRDDTQQPLYNKKIMLAIYDAVCLSKHFNKPSKSEFQMYAKETLRTTKERYRSRSRIARNKNLKNIDKGLWSK